MIVVVSALHRRQSSHSSVLPKRPGDTNFCLARSHTFLPSLR